MYPMIRMARELFVSARAPALPITGTHVSHHRCWPWDLDFWMELNNGRTLTLFDLGRVPMAQRMGLITELRKNRWGLTVAGSVVRYRKRVRLFDKVEMHSRAIGWDDKFFYIEQAMFLRGQPTSHIVLRTAVTDQNGIVKPERVFESAGLDGTSPRLPDWVLAWLEVEAVRPWPPMQDAS